MDKARGLNKFNKSRTRTASVAIGVAVLPLAISACSSSSGSNSADHTLKIVMGAEPGSLDPCDSVYQATGTVLDQNVTEPIILRDPNTGTLSPEIATSWKSTDGDKQWTLTLKSGLKFSNGDRVTATDVAASIDRTFDEQLACGNLQEFSEGALTTKVESPTKLVVVTPKSDPILPTRLSFVQVGPESQMTSKTKLRKPIGSGPFKLTAWDAGQQITLEKNTQYSGSAPTIANVQYQWRDQTSVAASMIKTGEADIALGLTPTDNTGNHSVTFPTREVLFLALEGGVPPLDNFDVRKAIYYATDTKGLAAAMFHGAAQPATQLVPEDAVGYNPDLQPLGYDLDKAKDLIAQAKADGADVGAPITIFSEPGFIPGVSDGVEIIAQEMRSIGLNVETKLVQREQILDHLGPKPDDGVTTALLWTHGNSGGDASFTSASWWGSGGANTLFGTPEEQAKISRAESASGDARQKAFAAAAAYSYDNVLGELPLLRLEGVVGVSPDVNFKPIPNTMNELPIRQVTWAK